MGADGVEQRQRAAAGPDHEPEVAVELGHVAGHAAVVLLVDGLAGELERRRLARLARLLVADPELLEQRLLARAGLVLHVHVRVDGDERAVRELGERVDLGQRHVVVGEQPREAGEDRRQARQRAARDADGGDHLLGLVVENGRRVEKWARPTWSGWVSATSSMSIPPMSEKISTGRLRVPSQVTPA